MSERIKPTPVKKAKITSPADFNLSIWATITEIGSKRNKGAYFNLNLQNSKKEADGTYTHTPKEFLSYKDLVALKDLIEIAMDFYNNEAGSAKEYPIRGQSGQAPVDESEAVEPTESPIKKDDIPW